jgi:uncharacterized protein YwgA
MNRIKRAAILCELITRLRAAGSWAGETHIQKAMYLLQDMLDVPTEYPYILYKHGPYSFDLSDDLSALRADGMLEEQIQAPPYGPRYAVTPFGGTLREDYPKTLDKHQRAIQIAATAIGDKNVGEVERLATALFVTRRDKESHDGSVRSRAERLNRLKPHVSLDRAVEAVEDVDNLIEEVEKSGV